MPADPASRSAADPGAHPTALLLDRLASLELGESQPEIYDRPVGLKLIYQDPASGAEHYLVRYPTGLRARRHRHTAAHTIIVLDGAMQIDGRFLGAGSYAHHPAGTVMHHAPATGRHCLFVIIFHGPFDVTRSATETALEERPHARQAVAAPAGAARSAEPGRPAPARDGLR